MENGFASNCLFSLIVLLKPIGFAEDGVFEFLPVRKGFLADVGSIKGC